MTTNNTSLNSFFKPSLGLKNTHVQTIFSSVGPRKSIISRRFKPYSELAKQIELDGGSGIRLLGYYNRSSKTRSNTIAILIHGWEGSHNSTYMQSMAMRLLENGIDVFRLNLRDHGDTHHLNEGVFNSTLIHEVMCAVENLQKKLPYSQSHLVGFSLGGNFALRLAAMAHEFDIKLHSVSAFCPAIHAAQSNVVLNQRSNWLYGHYFMRKWKRSLRTKNSLWPQYDFASKLEKLKSLDDMNNEFIPKYTDYDDIDEYFNAYAISGAVLDNTIAPCYLHFAEDDMIIPVAGVNTLSSNPNVHISVSKHGGHCGFISNWKGESWQDERVLSIIKSYEP